MSKKFSFKAILALALIVGSMAIQSKAFACGESAEGDSNVHSGSTTTSTTTGGTTVDVPR
ncbi:MAG TPA: hypothetical protein VL588_08890 [Bdellovibrionota bacterium]|jgi:hypothetical protein|nr:hypothetical protein [Bdellovibrionota bacterium]